MTSSHDELISRIQKCLALSTSPNLNEAAVAMEIAQRLMTKYNIELYQVEQHTGEQNETIVAEDYSLNIGSGAPVKWRQDLIFSIARHNFCRALAYTGRNRKMTIVGETHNIKMVAFFYEYLAPLIDKLADSGYETSEAKQVYPQMRALGHTDAWYWSSRSWKNGFRVRAVQMIDARLWALRKTFDTSSTTLVVTKDKQVKDKLEELFPKTSTHDKSTVYNVEGQNAGLKAGESISLNLPVGGTKSSQGALM